MFKFELALALGKTVDELEDMPHEELYKWQEFLTRRPLGWREDSRSAVIALSFGGGENTKPSDLFPSIKAVQEDVEKDQEDKSTWAQGLLSKVSGKLSEENPWGADGQLKNN